MTRNNDNPAGAPQVPPTLESQASSDSSFDMHRTLRARILETILDLTTMRTFRQSELLALRARSKPYAIQDFAEGLEIGSIRSYTNAIEMLENALKGVSNVPF